MKDFLFGHKFSKQQNKFTWYGNKDYFYCYVYEDKQRMLASAGEIWENLAFGLHRVVARTEDQFSAKKIVDALNKLIELKELKSGEV